MSDEQDVSEEIDPDELGDDPGGDVNFPAERYLGAPYLWGGRESLGLDCSGLVQQALFACGLACPRDADQQEEAGVEVAEPAPGDCITYGAPADQSSVTLQAVQLEQIHTLPLPERR